MEEFIKKSNKGYIPRKKVISISLDGDLIEYLDKLSESTGLDRSKIINFVLRQSQNLLATLNNQVELAKMLGFKTPNKMKRAIKRITEKAEKKKKA